MAQIHASLPEPDIAHFAGEPSRKTNGGPSKKDEFRAMNAGFARGRRWRYILSGAEHLHLVKVPSNLIKQKRGKRIAAIFAELLTSLSRCANTKKRGPGAAPRWFDVVDPDPWYEDTGPANLS